MAVWIALEGGEGTGKSTQATFLASALNAVLTREPGGTSIGAQIRSLLLSPDTAGLDGRAEALLMAADRAQHLTDVVMPALAAGRHVVSDRSAWSSLAYQGAGRGLPVDELWQLSDWAMSGRWPDIVVLVEVPEDVAAARVVARGDLTRFDSEDATFHSRVRAGFAALSDRWPERWARVDGTGMPEEVAARVLDVVRGRVALDP